MMKTSLSQSGETSRNLLNVLETTATAQKQKILARNNVLDAVFISEFGWRTERGKRKQGDCQFLGGGQSLVRFNWIRGRLIFAQ
jgi:hypothetical protein